jgi:hypothetical protein
MNVHPEWNAPVHSYNAARNLSYTERFKPPVQYLGRLLGLRVLRPVTVSEWQRFYVVVAL